MSATDEHGLTWRCISHALGPGGERCTRYACVGQPRLERLVQCVAGGELTESYHVAGLAQVYHSPGEAVAAMWSNPGPCS